ncbi:hypothetical protein CJF15_11310 [Clostridium botulinum]|uniref:hypothetical protein n=1 Tax=Clostridium botulinum TaxID=1491 RepID=UPI0007E05CE4|nr:hypothetical protein [Clostridium botulinum]KEI80128.1 hypothetical protein N487_03995 [Clostridium botulinum B2 331]MBN3409698.1 hypothetical protein [Clostridium botulinum]MBY6873234.1 hypothetical protein [Clostridium botulinum]MBY6888432.1 hypothetical protein [Clostridium botulinum]NFA89668.1 hypothetical protein [Clostridium botulinum]
MESDIRPTQSEIDFLNLAYNKFYDIYDEIFTSDSFWDETSFYRFSKIREVFCIYGEVQSYEPIQWALESMKQKRPQMESIIAKELFKCIRNILSHFPFYDEWDEVWISESLVNWSKPNQSIDKFIKKYLGHEEIKYRFWEANVKRMTYISIRFPSSFNCHDKVYLKDFLFEREGIKFAMILMKQVMDACIEN